MSNAELVRLLRRIAVYLGAVAAAVSVAHLAGSDRLAELSRALVPLAIAAPGAWFAYAFPLRLQTVRRFYDARSRMLQALGRAIELCAHDRIPAAEMKQALKLIEIERNELQEFVDDESDPVSPILPTLFASLDRDEWRTYTVAGAVLPGTVGDEPGNKAAQDLWLALMGSLKECVDYRAP